MRGQLSGIRSGAVTLLRNDRRLLISLCIRTSCDYGRGLAIGSIQPSMKFGNLLPMVHALRLELQQLDPMTT
jgi:hypothetical protein